MTALLATSAAALAASMAALWLLSLRLRDASIADVFWGPGLAGVGALAALRSPPSARGLLLAGCAAAWGLRLGFHLHRRWRASGEDRRYRAMRATWGPRFSLASLFTVFLLQGVLLWVVSLPLQAGAAVGAARPLGPLDAAGLILFAAGLVVEAAADAQLARFRADPANAGRVMDRGLWAWSRHPNYLGEAVLWWGLGLVAAAAGAWWALLGPALLTFLLLRVSGVALLERDIGERRPGYAAYAARTSAFLPWPPRRAP